MELDYDYTHKLLGCAYKVHSTLGPGLLESVYEAALVYELRSQGFEVKNQVPVKVQYGDIILDVDLRLDIIVDDKVILETPYEIMTQNFAEVNLRIKNKIIKSIQRYRRLKGYHSNGLLAMLWFYEDHDDILMSSEEINRPIYEPMKKYLERKRLEQKEKDDKSFTKRLYGKCSKLKSTTCCRCIRS